MRTKGDPLKSRHADPGRQSQGCEESEMFTKTRLRQVLRTMGCLRPRDHLKGLVEAQRLLRCHQAHPPTHDEEVAGRDTGHERWFIKVPTATRRLGRSWLMTGRNKRSRVAKDVTPVFSERVAEGDHEFTYASTVTTLREPTTTSD